MARKTINIGTTGNDATGDSIREGFNKVNQNFTEVYSKLGLEGGLNFTALDDTPSTLTANRIISVSTDGASIVEKTLEGDGIGIDFGTDPTKVIISNTGTEVSLDNTPELGGDLNAQNFLIENLGTPQKSSDAVNKNYADNTFLNVGGDTATGQILLNNGASPRVPSALAEAVNKQYADTKIKKDGDTMTGPLILSEDPGFAGNVHQAATKGYVDSNSFSSKENIFVSTNGRTEEQMLDAGVDQEQVGRSMSYAFSTIREACFYAERIMYGDQFLKDAGLLPSTHVNFFRAGGRKPGNYTVNLAADGTEDTTNVLANSLLVRNRQWIQEETIAFINREVADGDDSDDFASNFSYNRGKCYRDIGLIVDAVSFDMTYVGNSKTVDAALSYWDGATSRVAGQQSETVAAINFMKSLVQNYVLTNTAYPKPTATYFPNAVNLLENNVQFVTDETIAYINQQVAAGNGIWNGFTYDQAKCERDTKFILEGVAFDLKNGGNSKTVENADRYWDGATSKVAGQQPQTVAALNYARDLVRNYILTNSTFATLQALDGDNTTQFKTPGTNGESGADTKVQTLMGNLDDVITNGLGSLPALVGPSTNQSGITQTIDTAIVSESGASATFGTLIDIVTTVINSGIGAAPAKTGGQGREQNILTQEITVHVESGTYEELLPIKVPDNVSIKGDEFRRVILQPKVGVRPPARSLALTYEKGDITKFDGSSTLKAARFRNHYDSQYSRADTSAGINLTGNTQVRLKELVYYPLNGMYFEYNSVRYYLKNFVFDPAGAEDFTRADADLYSDINLTQSTTLQDDIPLNAVLELKKLNQHCDWFLMNNATILRNMSMRRHQGFVQVLDPEGQILTKSPYVQTCSSFSGQGGGGQYVDGNSGVQYGFVVDNPASGTTITLKGLTRKIQLPNTFLFQGSGGIEKKTYRIIGATAPIDDGDGNTPTTFKQTLTLAATTEITTNAKSLPAGTIPQGTELRIETAGNKSMTSNDYTQVNSDGYGLVATNNGLVETVSVFTYYCDIAYWARNGGQIRSLNGSNAYGRIGLQAEGSDPNENVQAGSIFFRELNGTVEEDSTRRDGTQDLTIHNPAGNNAGTGDTELQVRDFDYRPIEGSTFLLTALSINDDSTSYIVNDVEDVTVSISGISLASECVITTSTNHYYRDGAMVYITGANTNGLSGVDGVYYAKVTGVNTFKLCTDTALTTFVDTTAAGNPSYNGSGASVTGGGRVKFNLSTALKVGESHNIADGSRFSIKVGKQMTVRGLTDAPRVLPSSGLQFATGDKSVLRILGTVRKSVDEPGDLAIDYQLMTFDLTFPETRLNEEVIKVTTRISTLRATGHDFLNIGWGNYSDSNYPNNVFGNPVGKPDFSATQANEAVEKGVGRVFYASTDQDGNFRVGRFFRVNQGDGSVELNAEIGLTNVTSLGFGAGTTINEFSVDREMSGISDDAVPTEATVSTYLNSAVIGQHEDGSAFQEWTTLGAQTGGQFGLLSRAGYNGTNLSWNEMGGDLSLGSNKIINLIDGTQDSDAVTKNYTDNVFRGATTDSIRTDVKSFTMLNDSTLDTGAIDMNGNRIKSLRDPEDGSDAATKGYVDGQNRLGGLDSVEIVGAPADTDLLMFNGVNHTNGLGQQTEGAVNVALDITTDTTGGSPTFGEPTGTGSDVRFVRNANGLTISLATGSVHNTDVSVAAAIAQSKLSLSLGATHAAAPTGDAAAKQARSGLASFDQAKFDVTDGFVTIKDGDATNGIELDQIKHIGNNTILGNNSGSVGAVSELSGANIRTIIDFDNSVETYITPNVLANNEAIVQDGTNSMTGTLQTLAVRPTSDNSVDVGQAGARYNQVFATSTVTNFIQQHAPTGAQVEQVLQITGNGATPEPVIVIGDTTAQIASVTLPTLETTAHLAITDDQDVNYIAESYQRSVFIGKSRRLEVARTIELTGEATGSITFDGSKNESLTVTLDNTALDDQYIRLDGTTDATGTIKPASNDTHDLGTSALKWNEVHATTFTGVATTAQYADLAEKYVADAEYDEGTVVIFGGEQEVTQSTTAGDRKVAGVISTKPAYLMNNDLEAEHVAIVALTGRVPVKVIGPCKKGDILVTSSTPGYAKVNNDTQVGTVIGKALVNKTDHGEGTIEVVVGKQ